MSMLCHTHQQADVQIFNSFQNVLKKYIFFNTEKVVNVDCLYKMS